MRELREQPVSGDSVVQEFDPSNLEKRLDRKKFRWMPNPFMASDDQRQGGALYYSKFFADRDRRLDNTDIKKAIVAETDKLAMRRVSGPDAGSASRGTSRRKKAVWANYRPVSQFEADNMSSIPRVVKILVNEVFLVKNSPGGDSAERLGTVHRLEERLLTLISAPTHQGDCKSAMALIKAVYQFGTLRSINPELLSRCLEEIVAHKRHLKPESLVYLLEALSRLGFRDQRTIQILDSLSLCWPAVARNPDLFIRAANAVAKLDLYTATPYCAGMGPALAELLPRLTARQLERVKAVTLIHMVDGMALLDYFVLCHQNRITYARHLVMVFLSARDREDVRGKIPQATMEWMEEAVAAESNRVANAARSDRTSSPLHEDILRILQSSPAFNNPLLTGQSFGPFTFDILLPDTNTVIDACSEFLFYARTAKLTAEARLRHTLIRELEFNVLPVTHFTWNALRSDSDKAAYLLRQLSS